MILLGFIFQLFSLLLQIGLRDGRLIFLQYIFRHGDRAPTQTYPGDLTPPNFWTNGYGKLTQLGKKQHYELGKVIRNIYKDFITSNPNEVLVNSTDLDRCFSSGLSHMSSLYAPTAEWTFEEKLNWQPIPIHYAPYDTDKYLSMDSKCPKADEEEENIYKTPLYLQFSEKHKPMLQALSYYIGHIPSPQEVFRLYDAWYVEKMHNRPLPGWASLFYDQMEELAMLTMIHFVRSPLLQSLRSGPIISKMIDDIKRKINNEIPHLKVQVYSSRFHHIILLLNALGIFNNLTCNYCCTVLLELHELLDGSNAVRFLYLNSTTPEKGFQVPYVLTMRGCSEYCPLGFFVNHTRDLIPQNWEKECGLKDQPSVQGTKNEDSPYSVLNH